MVETIQKPATFEIFDWDGVRFFNSVFEPLLYLVLWLFPIFIDAKTNFKFSGSHRSPHQDRSLRNRLGRGSEPRPRRRSSSTGHAFRAGNYYYICVKNVAQNHGENFFCGL